MSFTQEPTAGTGYTWTQTRDELTLLVALPTGCTARDVSAAVTGAMVRVAARGSVVVSGELHGSCAGSVWSVDGGTLSYEIEKARSGFWPCALRGDPEVDVAALVAREKSERDGPYKPDPDADKIPQRVTGKDELRKLKAEFPHLDLDLGPNVHTATHRNFAGPRKTFEWGALPPEEVQAPAAPAAPAPAPAARADLGALPPTEAPSGPEPPWTVAAAAPSSSNAAATLPAVIPRCADGKYSWGVLPPGATLRTFAAAHEATPAAMPPSSSSQPPPPPQPIRGAATAPAGSAATEPDGPASASSAEAGTTTATSSAPGLYDWGTLPIS